MSDSLVTPQSEQTPFLWAEISNKKSERYVYLSEYLNQMGIQNQFEYIQSNEKDLGNILNEAQGKFKSIRFGVDLWDQLNLLVNQTYTDILRIKCIDSLYLDAKDGWWPALLFDDAISYYLSDLQKKLITTDPVYIIGSGGGARACIQGLIKLGYSKFNLSSENMMLMDDIQKCFQGIFFNTQFDVTKNDNITLLPGIHGVVINTLDFQTHKEYLRDYYYLNFLKKNGIVVDLNEVPLDTPFLKISEDIHAKTLSGLRVFAYSDFLWVKTAFGKTIDWKAYKAFLIEKLSSFRIEEDYIKQTLEEFQIKS